MSSTVQTQSLTPPEREAAERLFSGGPGALLADGWTNDEIRAFYNRESVQSYLAVLAKEFESREAIDARQRHLTRREAAQRLPKVLSIYDRILDGDEFLRGDDGEVLYDDCGRALVKTPKPDALQLYAARDILKLVNPPGEEEGSQSDLDILALLCSEADSDTSEVEYDPELKTEEERRESRTRVRTAIETLAPQLPQLRERVADKLAESAPSKSKKKTAKKTKATKKKTAKKKTSKTSAKKGTGKKSTKRAQSGRRSGGKSRG